MDILDDMGVSKLSARVFLKVNYSFNTWSDWKPKLESSAHVRWRRNAV